MKNRSFQFSDERIEDFQLLRYELKGFETLSLSQKQYIYCLSQATLFGRDITFDQFGKYNLRIRKVLEAIYLNAATEKQSNDFKALEVYLKRIWFSNGIYHHYGSEKFTPNFSSDFFQTEVLKLPATSLPLRKDETPTEFLNEILPVIFNPSLLAKKVNKTDGADIVASSACNFYEGVTQKEVEDYYAAQKEKGDLLHPISYGLNTTLKKENGEIKEEVWNIHGKYGAAIKKIVYWLEKAIDFCETNKQKKVIQHLIQYYTTGELSDFDTYSVAWVEDDKDARIDFINGFIEVYSDPLGLKGSWEGIVHYKDVEATKRTQLISENAQWFEDHSPIDKRFKKEKVKGISANVVCAAMLGGDEYPSTAIGINLPNADWIRAEYGSKSVTISNLIHAYDAVAKGNGFLEEFVPDAQTQAWIKAYGDQTNNLHTDLHECLGHGSGRLLDGVSSDALKNYGNTIEETRADLFGLYYIADEKLIELGLLDTKEAYKAEYYSFMLNGLMTQLVRINPGKKIEEAHMQNRALIAQWAFDMGKDANVVEIIQRANDSKDSAKTYIQINDYTALRAIFSKQLSEIQRIKSEGDYEAARQLVEKYAIHVDEKLHSEVLERYERLNIAPYKGFINPILKPVYDKENNITDILVDYSETYTEQMLRYSSEYATL